MKPRSALLISATLTAFVLMVIASVITAIQSNGKPSETVAQVEPTQYIEAAPQTADVVFTTQPSTTSIISAETAASIAVQILGRQDISSVTGEMINGIIAYKVTFISGDSVYISLDGQVISFTQAPPAIASNVSTDTFKSEHNREREKQTEHEGGDD